MSINRVLVISATLVLFFTACSQRKGEPITIAMNAWPGYEFLYLAEKKGFFEQVGANVELVQMGTLSDIQRAYINNRVDGIASTAIEVVQSELLGSRPIQTVLVTDYSNGGDVILAHGDINSIINLKGQKVGAEVSSLGIYVLQRALAQANMSLDDVVIINTDQAHGQEKLLAGEIKAFVSYPPYSVNILRNADYQQIFSSAEIPNQIIDTISLSKQSIADNPDIVIKLHQAWELALKYAKDNPKEARQIMAEREGISLSEFASVLSELIILDREAQLLMFGQTERLKQSFTEVCLTLVHVGSVESDCKAMERVIYSGDV